MSDEAVESLEDEPGTDLAGAVREPTVGGLPSGYRYGVTRYADIIMSEAFPERWKQLHEVLGTYSISTTELEAGGGGRTPFVARFDSSLEAHGWGKRNISVEKLVDGEPVMKVRGHEIDMFAVNSSDAPYPGIGCEMEWNNKDPFYDRDLLNFQALHHEGVMAVGIIVTRGPNLQSWLERVILHPGRRTSKYGRASTHWDKLVPRVNLGGGGECPLILIGIEPERITGRKTHDDLFAALRVADDFKASWRERGHNAWAGEAEHYHARLLDEAYALVGR